MTTTTNYLNLFNETMNNPKSKKIEYTISQNYVATLKEHWGIKELLANFKDANGNDFEMNFKNGTLLLKDENTGIDIKYMLIGNSGSREETDKIGEHGEGMKIGALTLVRLGYKVLIHTVGYTIAFGVEHSDFLDTEVMFAKYLTNDKKIGTEIFVECKKTEYEKAKQMFLSLVQHEKVTDNIVILPNKTKDIYLNGLSHIQKKAIFGYDIKKKGLISNRDRNFIKQSILEEVIVEFYNNLSSQKAINTIVEKFLEGKENFEKMFESRLVEQFSFSEELKKKFRKALPKKTYFVKTEEDIIDDEQTAIIVDDKLFVFLNYIGAKVIMDTGEFSFGDDDNIVQSFTFEKKKLPDEVELELNTSDMISSIGERKEDKGVYSLNKFEMLNEDEIKQFKLNFKIYKNATKQKFDNLFNNLLLLSAYNTEISFEHNGNKYNLETKSNKEKVQIFITKEEVQGYNSILTIKKETPFNKTKKEYIKQQENFIFVQDLRNKKINSIYSYQVKKAKHDWYSFESQVNSKVEEILDTIIKEQPRDFFQEYFRNINSETYETKRHLYGINEISKEVATKVFKQLYKKTCLTSQPLYDNIVSEKYGYKLLSLNTHSTRNFLESTLQIPTSQKVYTEKQKEKIHSIPYTEEMEKGVKLFKQTFPYENVQIELTPLLPNNKESTNEKGVIYISKNATKVPEFIAALIMYELEQIDLNCVSPSHELQSALTHNLLG